MSDMLYIIIIGIAYRKEWAAMKYSSESLVKKTAAAVMSLFLLGTAYSTSALAAPKGPPPGHGRPASHRVHVNPGARMRTPVHNRVRMTNPHSSRGPVGGRMASIRPAPPRGSGYVHYSTGPRVYHYYPVVAHHWHSYSYGPGWVGYPVYYYGPSVYYGHPFWRHHRHHHGRIWIGLRL